MGAAALLDKLVDELTPYYQNLVEQMPARTRTLFDALIRQSEPCSQSELAERVGTTQNRIAQHFSWLRERHLVVGKKRSGKREYLYQVSDRLFVQYYRKRYLLHDNYTPLAGMAELLDGFFSAAQNREQILMLMENGRLDEATEFVRAALFRNQGELGDWVQKTDNRTAIEALAASENGDHRLAIDLYRKALIMADIDEDRVGKALILGQLGLNASHLRRFSDAIVAHQKALEIWQSQDKPAVTAWVLSQLAQEFRGALQFDNALKYAKMALKIWKSRGAEDRVASIWGEIGENLRQIGRSEEAVDAYLRAEEFWKSKKDGAAVGWTLGGIGLARRDVGRFREAIQSHKQALEALETVPTRKRSMALNLGWIASSHRMLTEYSEALENDQAALQIFEEMNEPRRLIKTLSSISLNYLGLNDFGNAFSNLQKAFDIAVESNFQDQIIWTTAQLCHLHLNVGEPMQILKQLDKSPVLDTHKLYETVLTKCGSALGLIEERDGRAAAFKEGLKVLEGLLLRDEHVPANESMTYLLSGLLESQRAFPLLQDLAFEAASMEGGLSDLRRKALELSTKFIVNRDDESLLENIDPDVSAAVRAIIDASKSRRRNGEA
ncbi:MAG: tetratricopeptide repeat protein [Planctomycetaceae bacterium]|nr:tetratricopeptide repeat protein [Planctomycetaceae bacterium]